MFVTGPKVVREVIGEEISAEQLGGAKKHSSQSGVAHIRCHTEIECFRKVRDLLKYILYKTIEFKDTKKIFLLGNKRSWLI